MLNALGLRARLLISFGAIALLLGLVGGVSLIAFEKITATYGKIADVTLPNAVTLGQLLAGEKDIVIGISNLLGSDTSIEDLKLQSEVIRVGRVEYEAAKAEYLATAFEPGEEKLWDVVDASFKPLDALVSRLLELSSHGDKKEFIERDNLGKTELFQLRKRVRVSLANLVEFQSANAKKLRIQAESIDRTAKVIIATAAVIGFLTAILLGFILSNSLSRILSNISRSLGAGAANVRAAAQQIAAASEQLSAAVTEQASSLEETSASIEEINAMIARNAENSHSAAAGTQSAKQSVEQGQTAIHEVSQAINHIQQSNEAITKQTEVSGRELAEIVQMIGEIANKTKVINEIVFQTKLLSFNASVEAARAGEHGKGFAVVAEEVGNLAAMSGSAAKEIGAMLASSITRVEAIVSKNQAGIADLVRDSKERIQGGERLVEKCSDHFADIVQNVSQVDQMSAAISTASSEQKTGVQEVTRAIAQLSQVNSQNASASGQAVSAAESLAAQSIDLESLVKQLAQIVEGLPSDQVKPDRKPLGKVPAKVPKIAPTTPQQDDQRWSRAA